MNRSARIVLTLIFALRYWRFDGDAGRAVRPRLDFFKGLGIFILVAVFAPLLASPDSIEVTKATGGVLEAPLAGRVVERDLLSLQADLDELVFCIPGTHRGFGRNRKRNISDRLGIIVFEIVHQLLDPNGVLRRKLAVVEESSDIGV